MRPICLATAAAIGLVTLSALTLTTGRAQSPTSEAVPVNEDPPFRLGDGRTLTFRVEGSYQSSGPRAMQVALTQAREQLADHLRQQDPPLLWTPDVEFIQKRLVRN